MAHVQTQPRPMSPPCPPPSPRYEPQRGLGDVEPPVPPSYDMVYLGARLQMVSSMGLSDCSCAGEGRPCHFPPNESTFHDLDPADASPGSASLHDDDDATVIDASSPAPSRWSEAETILENPTTYRDKLGNWNLRKHRTSARSYQELWPSSPTSLAHTMPTASLLVHDTISPTKASARKMRASRPQPRIRAAQISPPILDASSVNAANITSVSDPTSAGAQSWPGLVPYCPHRKVPTPNKQTEQSEFDPYSDEEEVEEEEEKEKEDGEEAIDTSDQRKRNTLGRFRRRVSSGFQVILCRGG